MTDSELTREEAEYEAKLRAIENFHEGRTGYRPTNNGPQKNPPNPSICIEIEVGERTEPDLSGQPRNAPGINVLRTDEDDWYERHGSYSVLKPGKTRRRD